MVYKRKCNLQEQNLKLLHYICEEDLINPSIFVWILEVP